MKTNEEYERERQDLKNWRERNSYRQGSKAQPVPSGRRYQRKDKHVSRSLDQG